MAEKNFPAKLQIESNLSTVGAPSAPISSEKKVFHSFIELCEKISASPFTMVEVCAEAGIADSTIYEAKKRGTAPRKTTMRKLRKALARLEREVLA